MKTTLKILGFIFGPIILLAIIVVVGVLILAQSTPGIVSDMTPVVSSQQSVQAFETKWNAFNTAVQNTTSGTPVSINVTQEEITSKVNQELANVKLPEGLSLGNVSINFQDGKALVSAPVKYSALSGTAGMALAVQTVNGVPTISVQDIDFGALPIPQALKDQLTGLIPNGGKIDIGNLPVDITGIQIIDGQLVMNGVTK